ncbi:MAG: GTPase ObgE [Verrucomicrobiota bacterium]|jgi:GTP-binding protein
MFVDRVKFRVKGGDGGNGCVSFLRLKFMPNGGPAGGDGGHGGSIILRADTSQQSLIDLKYCGHVEATRGGNGEGRDRHGLDGEDRIVLVPPGTLVMDSDNSNYLLGDLANPGDELVVARGGHGGKGNRHFATAANRVPRKATHGDKGEAKTLFLELRTIADCGLVGYPNAGKSTFINAVTRCGARTAPYPFTTLEPQVGVREFDDFTRLTIADIPGLVEGAADNVGLGHDFLRHIERTHILAMVLDMAGTDDRDPLDDMAKLNKELELYQPGLSGRIAMILANKMDEPGAAINLERLRAATQVQIFPITAELKEGTEEALQAIRALVNERRAAKTAAAPLKDVHRKSGRLVVDLHASDEDFRTGDEQEHDLQESRQHAAFLDDTDDDEVEFDSSLFDDPSWGAAPEPRPAGPVIVGIGDEEQEDEDDNAEDEDGEEWVEVIEPEGSDDEEIPEDLDIDQLDSLADKDDSEVDAAALADKLFGEDSASRPVAGPAGRRGPRSARGKRK